MANEKLRQIAAETLSRAGGVARSQTTVGQASTAVMQKQIALAKEQTTALDRMNDELSDTAKHAESILEYEKELLKVRRDSATGIGKYAERMNWLGHSSKVAAVEVKKMDTHLGSLTRNVKSFGMESKKISSSGGGGGLFGSLFAGGKNIGRGIIGDYVKSSTMYMRNLYQLGDTLDFAGDKENAYSKALQLTGNAMMDYDNSLTNLNKTATLWGVSTSEAADMLEKMNLQLREGPEAARKASEGAIIYGKVLGIGTDAAQEFFDKSVNGWSMTVDAARDSLAEIRQEIVKNNDAHKDAKVFIDQVTKATLDLRDQSVSANVSLRATAKVLSLATSKGQELGMSYNQALDAAKDLGGLLQKPPPWVQYYSGREMAGDIAQQIRGLSDTEANKKIEDTYSDALKGLDETQKKRRIEMIKQLATRGSYSDVMTLQELTAGSAASMKAVLKRVRQFGTGAEGGAILKDAFGVKDFATANTIAQLAKSGDLNAALEELRKATEDSGDASKELEDQLPVKLQVLADKASDANGMLDMISKSTGYIADVLKTSFIAKFLGNEKNQGSQVGTNVFGSTLSKIPLIGGLLSPAIGAMTVGSALTKPDEYVTKKVESLGDVANDAKTALLSSGSPKEALAVAGAGLSKTFDSESSAVAGFGQKLSNSEVAMSLTKTVKALGSHDPKENPLAKPLHKTSEEMATMFTDQTKNGKRFIDDSRKMADTSYEMLRNWANDMIVAIAELSPEGKAKLEAMYGPLETSAEKIARQAKQLNVSLDTDNEGNVKVKTSWAGGSFRKMSAAASKAENGQM